MAGTLTISTLSDGTNSTSSTNCIQGSAKAWVVYNLDAQTILRSYNVSSVTYNSSGIFRINFTNAMPDANYGAGGGASFWSTSSSSVRGQIVGFDNISTTYYPRTTTYIWVNVWSGTQQNCNNVFVSCYY